MVKDRSGYPVFVMSLRGIPVFDVAARLMYTQYIPVLLPLPRPQIKVLLSETNKFMIFFKVLSGNNRYTIYFRK